MVDVVTVLVAASAGAILGVVVQGRLNDMAEHEAYCTGYDRGLRAGLAQAGEQMLQANLEAARTVAEVEARAREGQARGRIEM